MATNRNTLVRALAKIDGVILEARSHVEKPGDDTESKYMRLWCSPLWNRRGRKWKGI